MSEIERASETAAFEAVPEVVARPRLKRTLMWNVRSLAEGIGWDVRELHRRSGVFRESLDRIWDGSSLRVGLATMERLRDALGLDQFLRTDRRAKRQYLQLRWSGRNHPLPETGVEPE